MLWRLLILSTAVGALRTPGRPAGSLPKPHQHCRNFDRAEIFDQRIFFESSRKFFGLLDSKDGDIKWIKEKAKALVSK